jgi:Domain of unknown function (DUF4160)
MPTVYRIGATRVVIYPNDHRPAHVHVIGIGKQAVFNMCCPDGPPAVRENHGFSTVDLNVLAHRMQGVIGQLCNEWRVFHGNHH